MPPALTSLSRLPIGAATVHTKLSKTIAEKLPRTLRHPRFVALSLNEKGFAKLPRLLTLEICFPHDFSLAPCDYAIFSSLPSSLTALTIPSMVSSSRGLDRLAAVLPNLTRIEGRYRYRRYQQGVLLASDAQ